MASEAPERINVQVSPLTGDLHLPTFLHLGGWDTVAYVRADLAASTPAPGCQQPDLTTVERMEIRIELTAEGLWRATCPQDRSLHVVGKTPAGALHAASDALAEVAGGVWGPSEGRRAPASHRFRKKVVIEAVQLGAVGETEPSWWTKAYTGGAARLFSDGHAEIDTLEGTIHAEVGDWIIRGVKGELYPCKPDIFADSYEPADAPASPRQEREALIEAMLWAYEGANRALMGPVGDARGARAGMEAALDAILASGFMVPASAAEEREALEKEIAAALFAETFGGTSDPDLTDLALGLAETQARAVADRLTTAGYVTPSAHAAALRERWEAGRDEAVNWLRLVASIVDHDLGHERASVYISVANEIAAFTPPEDSK